MIENSINTKDMRQNQNVSEFKNIIDEYKELYNQERNRNRLLEEQNDILRESGLKMVDILKAENSELKEEVKLLT